MIGRASVGLLMTSAGALGGPLVATWLAPVGGSWADASNWSTPDAPNNGVPQGAAYHAVIDVSGAPYTVALGGDVAVDRLTLCAADATLEVSGALEGSFDWTAGRVQLDGGSLTHVGTGNWTVPLSSEVRFSGGGVFRNAGSIVKGNFAGGDVVLETDGPMFVNEGTVRIERGALRLLGELDNRGILETADTGAIHVHAPLAMTAGSSIRGDGALYFWDGQNDFSDQLGAFEGLLLVYGGGLDVQSDLDLQWISIAENAQAADFRGRVDVFSFDCSTGTTTFHERARVRFAHVRGGAAVFHDLLEVDHELRLTGVTLELPNGLATDHEAAIVVDDGALMIGASAPDECFFYVRESGVVGVSSDISVNGVVHVWVGATANGAMMVDGEAALDGSLVVNTDENFAAAWGDRWTVMTYASRVGDFESVYFPDAPAPLRWFAEAGTTSYVVGVAHVADVNRDGVVGFGDLNIVVSHFNAPGGWSQGDVDGDGFVGFADLNVVLGVFGAASPSR